MTNKPVAQGEARFFIDHTMIHDRITGKHVTCDPDFRDYVINPGETTRINNPDGISNTCALLNSLAAQPRAVPDGWVPSTGAIMEWIHRQNFDVSSIDEARHAIEDARSMHVLAAPQPEVKS